MTHHITITGEPGDQVLKCDDCSWAKHFDGWTITTIDKGDGMGRHLEGILEIRTDLVLQEQISDDDLRRGCREWMKTEQPVPDVFAEFLGGMK